MRLKYQQDQEDVADLVRYMVEHVTRLEEDAKYLKARNEQLQEENIDLQSKNDRLIDEITAIELRNKDAAQAG